MEMSRSGLSSPDEFLVKIVFIRLTATVYYGYFSCIRIDHQSPIFLLIYYI